ncbi:uncharacterized protein LOC128596630 [Nycticebus coucang]|uniref:uncharacterized protein LOC128596630 n=1 Tax=Nycticebus coucang TaxID=9470 RepID=UPI00234CF111|nr:uncharacterized protein LOC128596630 [Nycticebus coucang]
MVFLRAGGIFTEKLLARADEVTELAFFPERNSKESKRSYTFSPFLAGDLGKQGLINEKQLSREPERPSPYVKKLKPTGSRNPLAMPGEVGEQGRQTRESTALPYPNLSSEVGRRGSGTTLRFLRGFGRKQAPVKAGAGTGVQGLPGQGWVPEACRLKLHLRPPRGSPFAPSKEAAATSKEREETQGLRPRPENLPGPESCPELPTPPSASAVTHGRRWLARLRHLLAGRWAGAHFLLPYRRLPASPPSPSLVPGPAQSSALFRATRPPWSGPGPKSSAAQYPNWGLRAAAERPLALRREPRRNPRGWRRENSARAEGGGSRVRNQEETRREKLVAPRRALPLLGMGPAAARPLPGPPGRD